MRTGMAESDPLQIASDMNLSNVLFIQDVAPLRIAVPVYGYIFPVVVIITLVTNSFIVLVLSQPQLRTPTNCVLLAMAVTELLTGLVGLPWMLYYYTMGGFKLDEKYGMPGFWCKTSQYFAEILPTVFHTSAIWLTVYLAIQRYWFVCTTPNRRSITPNTNQLTLILSRCRLAVGLICSVAVLVELPIMFGKYSTPYYAENYTFCLVRISNWVWRIGPNYFFSGYYWFHVIFVHAGPCTLLVIFCGLLIQTVRDAMKRRRESLGCLLRDRDRGSSGNLHATTKMLLVVVVIFLITEIPAALIFTLHVLSNTFSFLPLDSYPAMNTALIFRNIFILVSYPFNFAVYLSMSHQFRNAVRRIFCRQSALQDSTIYSDPPRRSGHCRRKMSLPFSSHSCSHLPNGRALLMEPVCPRPRSVSFAPTAGNAPSTLVAECSRTGHHFRTTLYPDQSPHLTYGQ